ncbi:hypothetical protein Q1695_007546 [Nippostrongylus brasiliensis]|nr:hypothetical protein Q1695_007546 [Nippostrongylus brasiliensis]
MRKLPVFAFVSIVIFIALGDIFHLTVSSESQVSTTTTTTAIPLPFNLWCRKLNDQVKEGTYNTAPFDKNELLPPFEKYFRGFQVSQKYHLARCRIAKVMTTLTYAIFCYISNSTEFDADNRRISTENVRDRFCGEQNIANGVDIRKLLGPQAIQFAIVRDPVDRFLSGFVEKCVR